jgi:hypothetical protein
MKILKHDVKGMTLHEHDALLFIATKAKARL